MGFLKDITTPPTAEQKELWAKQKEEHTQQKIERNEEMKAKGTEHVTERVEKLLAEGERVIYHYPFINNLLVATTRKVIFLDVAVGKTKTYYAVPYSRITNLVFEDPTGLSVTTKVRIFAGGDAPAISIDTKMGTGLIEICQIIASMI